MANPKVQPRQETAPTTCINTSKGVKGFNLLSWRTRALGPKHQELRALTVRINLLQDQIITENG